MSENNPIDHASSSEPPAEPAEPRGRENTNADEAAGADQGGRWVAVARSDAVADGKAVEVLVEDQILAIFRHAGTLYALDGMCAHQGGPLAQGSVAHGCVTCPWHGWQYELATGIQTINRQPLQRTFAVREREGQIEVRL